MNPAPASPDPAQPLAGKRICIVLLTGLGDVVMGLPVANALKRHAPGVHITWVSEPMPSGILRPHPAVDELVVYEKKKGARGILDLSERLRGGDFELTLNLNYYFKSVWPTLLSRAPRRIGFDWGRSRDGTWFAHNEHIASRPRSHTQEMFLEFLDHLEVPREPVEWRIALSEQERIDQASFFRRFEGRPVVAVVPASANERKDWFASGYARVVDALQEEMGYAVMLVGGPGERETRIAREVSGLSSSAPVWALGDGVRRLAWLLEGSQLVIAPDTGPVHISRALDVPVIGLYGHTNPWRVGPYGRFQDLWIDMYTEPDEAPDPSRFDPKQGRMERIAPELVLERVQRARSLYPSTTRARDFQGVGGTADRHPEAEET
jgi:heptosyltransferase I